jgi:predicted nucleic acid-binding protein
VASLVDTNILVDRFDPRDPVKQRRADEVLREGLLADSVLLAHQSIVELVAAVTRPRGDLGGAPLLTVDKARLAAEELVAQFPVLYPDREIVLTALRAGDRVAAKALRLVQADGGFEAARDARADRHSQDRLHAAISPRARGSSLSGTPRRSAP